jgi:Zn ribbon nucleic-acid-binding protein
MENATTPCPACTAPIDVEYLDDAGEQVTCHACGHIMILGYDVERQEYTVID